MAVLLHTLKRCVEERSMLQSLYEYLKIMRNPWKDVEKLRKIQEKMMRAIIQFAYSHTRFYKEKFRKAGIEPSDIQTLEDIRKIPVCTKDEVRSNPEALFAAGYNRKNCIVEQTTGCTGKILPILHDRKAYSHFFAVDVRRFLGWGYRPWDKLIYIAHDETRRTLLDKLRLLRRYSVSIFLPEKEQIEIIKKINPHIISAYPSTIKAIMNALEEGDLDQIELKFILLNSEILTEKVRNQTRKIFSCDVFEEYSTYEVYSLAHECPLYKYHLDIDNVLVNFLDENDEEVSYGERGKIVVTSLVNRAMPFIRYELGDIGIPSDEKCECGRNFPVMKLIEGRADDFLIMPTGALVSPRKIVPLVEITPGIKEFQILQEKKNLIRILTVKDTTYTKEGEEKMIERVKNLLKEDIVIEPEYIDQIPRKRGKLRIVTSKVMQ
jgi:phenylacetate-CoA ligase